ncbi:MAG: hypothetical protein QUV04_02830 [Synechococcus sp. WH 8007]|nr:hypothetical protein [Synechococcus sp. WH 8007]
MLIITLYVYRRLELNSSKRRIGWLFRALYFSFITGPGALKVLDERLAYFQRYVESIETRFPSSETRLIGHSVGSYLALMISAQLTGRDSKIPFKLVTLGQSPVFWLCLSSQKKSIHSLLVSLSSTSLAWLDVVSSDDWMSFSGIELSDYLEHDRSDFPTQLNLDLAASAGLSKIPRVLLNHQFKLHFQYFRCGSTPSSLAAWLPLPLLAINDASENSL